MLIMVIGFPCEDQAGVLDVAPDASRLVDLDTIDPGTPIGDPACGAVVLIARTLTDLRRAVSLTALLPKAAHHVVAVAMSSPEQPFSAAVAAHEGPLMLSFQARRKPAGDWWVEARFAGRSPVGGFVAALVRGLGGGRLQTMPGPRIALAGAGSSHWRPGDSAVTLTALAGPLGNPEGPPPADLILRAAGPDLPVWTDPRVGAVIDRHPVGRLSVRSGAADERGTANTDSRSVFDVDSVFDADLVPPVDERSVNPTGFVVDPRLGDAVLTLAGDRWSVQMGQESLARFHPSGEVTDADVSRLRQVRAVTIDWGNGTPSTPLTAARVVAGLAAAGVPLQAAQVPSWALAVGAELTDLVTEVKEDDLTDNLRREEHSIRLRRAALRTHSTEARWRSLAGAAGLPIPPRPAVSVVLCTRRPEFLGFALRQIAGQRNIDLELILTLHGIPADLPEVKAAIAAFDRPITVIEAPDGAIFGEALNQGVARASGRYVAKWDDDDWYSPDFLADMVMASCYAGAELVGCYAQLVYLGQIDVTIYRKGRSECMNRLVSGGTFVMERSALDAVGGFPLVPRHVDAALLDALSAAGARIYRAHSLGYALHRRAAGHTWDQPVTYFLRAAALQWRGMRFGAFIDPADTPLPETSIGSLLKQGNE